MPATGVAAGSWEAFATAYRRGGNNLLNATVTAGTGTLVQATSGNIFDHIDTNIVEAGGLVSNITSANVTVQEAAAAANGSGIWTMAGGLFSPPSVGGALPAELGPDGGQRRHV